MSEITTLLHAASGGDGGAADRLFTLLYADLRRLARSRLHKSGHLTMLETTALVHESFLRFRGAGALDFPDRDHFLAYAARVMRTVVVDLVRARQADRRGGHVAHLTLDTAVADEAAVRAVLAGGTTFTPTMPADVREAELKTWRRAVQAVIAYAQG